METAALPILLAQCKAYQSIEEISKAIENLIKIQSTNHFNIHVSLPYSFIEPLSKKFAAENITLGAEVLLDADEGSFTASIVAKMLEQAKAKFVLIGTEQDRTSHSSNGHHLKKKVKAALDAQAHPFVCIGETLHEHQDKISKDILKAQLKDCLEGFSPEELKKLYVVYNADWISRTPWEATSPELQEAYTTFIEVITEILGPETLSKNQLIITVPAYSEELAKLIRSLQENPDSPPNFSLGILGLSSEFLQPLLEISPNKAPKLPVESEIPNENIPLEKPSEEIIKLAKKPRAKKEPPPTEPQGQI